MEKKKDISVPGCFDPIEHATSAWNQVVQQVKQRDKERQREIERKKNKRKIAKKERK